MKKYVKPELFFESFELSQSIAACGIDVNHENKEKCTPTLDGDSWPGEGGMTLFGQGKECINDISIIEVYCYTVGTNEAGRLFNS